MNINLPAIKLGAKRIIPFTKPNIVTVGMFYLILQFFASYYALFATGMYHMLDEEFANYWLSGQYDYATTYITRQLDFKPTTVLIMLLLYLVVFLVSYGFMSFVLKTVRGQERQVGTMLDGFPLVLRILAKYVVQLLILVPCFLVIVPGYMLFYAYRLSDYLLLDRPELSPIECLRESRRLMKGHKLELFRLDLSFLGWILVSGLGAVGMGTRVWSLPLMETSYVLYYEAILAVDRDEGPCAIDLDTVNNN